MSHKSLKVLIITANTGHLSIAQAIADHLHKHKINQSTINLSDSLFNLYTPFYLYFPYFFKIPYKLGEYQRPRQLLNLILKAKFSYKVEQLVKDYQPHIIISTWCYVNPVIEKLQSQYNFKFLNVITDPRSIHVFIPSPKAINFVFDQTGVNKLKEFGIPKNKIVKSGWFVRHRFEQSHSQKQVRQKLKLPPDQLTLLIAAGSEGTHFVLKILPTFINANTPLTAIFACGKNKRLAQIINQADKAKKLLGHTKTKLITLPFTSDIDQYLKSADLCIGKAGPNLLFESIATHTPFFAITHISGQEDGNLDLISELKLGYVQENPLKANQLLKEIITNPDQLKQFQPSTKKLAHYNSRAKDILLSHIK